MTVTALLGRARLAAVKVDAPAVTVDAPAVTLEVVVMVAMTPVVAAWA